MVNDSALAGAKTQARALRAEGRLGEAIAVMRCAKQMRPATDVLGAAGTGRAGRWWLTSLLGLEPARHATSQSGGAVAADWKGMLADDLTLFSV